MKMRNRDVKRYCNDIRKSIPYFGKEKRAIMDQIESMVTAYEDENLSADYDAMVSRFGSPEQIAFSYIDETDTSSLAKKLQNKRIMLRIMGGTCAAIIIIWLGFAGVALVNNLISSDGSIYSHIEVIEEETFSEVEN